MSLFVTGFLAGGVAIYLAFEFAELVVRAAEVKAEEIQGETFGASLRSVRNV